MEGYYIDTDGITMCDLKREVGTMSKFYHVTMCEIEANTEVEIRWVKDPGQFHLSIGDPCNRIGIMLDPDQLERLASVIRVAQAERDIATGRFVPDDGDGPVLGGEPMKIGS